MVQFSANQLLVGAVGCLLAVPSMAYCPNGMPLAQPVRAIGADTGDEFCEQRWDEGAVIKGLEVWSDDKEGIMAISYLFSDDKSSGVLGRQTDGETYEHLTWDPSTTTVSQLKLWGDGQGKQCGKIYLRLSDGKELEIGKDVSGQDTFEQDVGSGIMLAGLGRVGYRIDRCGFGFLKGKVEKVTIDDVEFEETAEELNKKEEGIMHYEIDEFSHRNLAGSGAADKKKFGTKVVRSNSKEFSEDIQHNFGITQNVEVSGKIFDLGVSAGYSLSYSYTNTQGTKSSQSEETTIDWITDIEVGPGESKYCIATVSMGEYEGIYTSTVNVRLEGGEKYGFKRSGTMKQVTWTKAESLCKDTPIGDDERPGNKIDLTKDSKRAVSFIS